MFHQIVTPFGIGKAIGKSDKYLGKALTLEQCSLMVDINQPSANAAMMQIGPGFQNCVAIFNASGSHYDTGWRTLMSPSKNLISQISLFLKIIWIDKL